ncbi:unnamed protein product [Brassica napus]|nr:unnamed protein product [Brassica napus]
MAALERSPPPGTSSAMRNAFGTVLSALLDPRLIVVASFLPHSLCALVRKYESVIHEFDPYFNYRVTQFLSKNGIYEFWNWFDDRTWYPPGRVIGGTVYPGLTLTVGTIWWVLNSLNIPLSVETVCVFTAPVFSAFASWATYLLTKGSGAGLTAAALLAMVSLNTRTSCLFLLISSCFVFYCHVFGIGASFSGICYKSLIIIDITAFKSSIILNRPLVTSEEAPIMFHMVTTNIDNPQFVLYYIESLAPTVCMRLQVVLGTLLAALVPVVGFNAVLTSEHFASFLVFIIIHVVALVYYIKGILSPKMFKVAATLVVSIGLVVCLIVVAVLMALVASSPTGGWSGRSLSLLDPTYASKYIPIIASVSEHQPPTWPSYFMDINVLAFLVPAGIVACFSLLSDASSFVVLYIVMSVYFSGVMVRLMLVLAPAACIMSGIARSQAFDVFTASIKYQLGEMSNSKDDPEDKTSTNNETKDDASSAKGEKVAKERPSKKGKKKEREPADKPTVKSKIVKKRALVLPLETSIVALRLLIMLGAFYVIHCVWAAAEAYSAPSIVLTSQSHDGLHVFDDFRESYAWLSHNTDVDDKVASWWDYGYQTTAMANRTVIVDNNTWNNTHIATVGTAMSSPEKAAWEIFNSLDVKYVLVVFGGVIGYSSDDINKFLWMVRIGGGVFPHIKEADYLRDGQYRIDSEATPTILNCLMYRYEPFLFVETDGKGYDRVRRTEIGKKNFKLTHFEEVFTSHHWMVRIYKLKPQKNRIRGKGKKLKLKTSTGLSSKTAKKNPWM